MKKIKLCLSVLLMVAGCQSVSRSPIETFVLNRGDFVQSVTETGELEAVNAVTISAPRISWRLGNLKITRLVEDGQQVNEGDLLVEFEKAEVQKSISDAQAELEIALAEMRKTRATQASQIEELTADLERSKIQHRISELNLEKATFESDIRRKEIELNLENAAIALEKAKQDIENQKRVNHEEISKLELRVEQVKTRLEEALESLELLTVTAPSPGIAIIRENRATDLKFQVDDQPWRCMDIIDLPDLSKMQAKVMINEVDISRIDLNQKAFIRLDAFPDTAFIAHVSEVAALARNKERGSNVKIFDVKILIDENDETLMPGMTVSCEIIVDSIEDTLFVPLEAVFRKNGDTVVFVKKGSGFEMRSVTVGEENDDFVIVAEGLVEGDEIALIDPTELALDMSEEKIEETGGQNE
jgi:HlyD family secretion protein